MNGAAKPAKLPTVLISAMPAAAAAPDRKRPGIAQKLGSAEKIAHAVIVIVATVAAGDCMYRANGTLSAPTSAGTAMCHVRTPRFVASRLQKYNAKAAGRYGIAVIRPFSKTLNLLPN